MAVEVHNVYALYYYSDDGDLLENPALRFERPEDWADRERWHYRHIQMTLNLDGVAYEHHCHVWSEVVKMLPRLFAAVGQSLFQVMLPGDIPELCGPVWLHELDWWDDAWGTKPPIWQQPDGDHDLEGELGDES